MPLPDDAAPSGAPDFLTGGGEMGALMRAHAWAATPIGPPDRWPQPLRTLVGVMLSSNQPMFIAWGGQRTLLYNNAYAEILAAKHPAALGRDFLEVWQEIRADLQPIVEQAYGGQPVQMDDIELWMERRGFREETHFSFSYTPVRDEAGAVAGFFCPCVEITGQVLAERRRAEDIERQRRLFEQAPGFITILAGPYHVFEFANAAYRRLFGDRVYVGRAVREVFPELVDQAFFGLLDQVYASGERFVADRIPIRLHPSTAAPDERYLDFIYEPVIDETGRVTGIFVVGHDVTAAHHADAALRAHAARQTFRLAIEERLHGIADPAEAIAAASEALGRHLAVDRIAYGEVEAGDETLLVERAWTRDGGAGEVRQRRLDDYGAAVAAGLARGERVAVAEIGALSALPDAAAAGAAASVGAFLGVPVVKAGRLVAVLAVESATPRAWPDDEVALIEGIAERIWAAGERATATRALRESEARFRLMADASPSIVWVTDAAGRTEFFNAHWYDYTGADERPTSVAEVAAAFVHPDDAEPTLAAFAAARDAGTTFLVEHRILSRSGEYRWFMVRGEPYRDPETGEIVKWFGASVDIHDRRIAEAALRESEARLGFLDRLSAATAPLADADAVLATTTRLLGEHLQLAICAYADMDEDQDGFTIRGDWAAPGSASIVGRYSLAAFGELAVERLGAGLPLVVNDNRRELAPEAAATFQSIGIAATICMPLVKEDRLTALMAIHDRVPRRWTEAEQNLLREVTARSWAHVERVAAAAELRASEARYRTLFETIDAGFCVVEMIFDAALQPVDYCFVEANPAFERQTGLVDVVGRTARDLVPDLEAPWFELYGRVALTGEPARFEQGSDAMGRWFDVHALRVGGPDSRRVAILFNDISDRRASEERLRELNDTLETRVVERTAELQQAHEQLRQSQKLEAMGQLTGGVAHDFNNLLSPIVGGLDLLQRKGLGGERERRLIDGALQSAERARVLVQRLLAFARRQPLQPKPVDLGALISGMADLVASTSGPQIRVVVDVGDELPAAFTDPNQVEMAILNLSVNARDAMRDGGVLRISAEAETVGSGHRARLRPGRYVRLSVADTGSGMDADTLKKAVEPFFSTKGVGRGTGLGLSMVHGLASQLGGSLTIESRPGLGTNVEVWLPATDATAEPPPQAEGADAPPAAGTALVVDDERLVRASTADMLADLGYRVVEAGSAEEALRLLNAGQPIDVLVTDHLMPGMTGTELAREVRSRWPVTRLLVVSGYAEVDGVASDLPRLVKPFRQADLAAKLGERG